MASKLATLTFIAILIMLTPTVSGASVGVAVDDWAKYRDFSASWSSDFPGQTKPSQVDDMANTEWAKITVQSVSGTVVTVQEITHYKNGTERTTTQSGDVATGSGNMTFFIIPPNLGPGDTLTIAGIPVPTIIQFTINDTATKTYAGVQREVNHFGYHTSSTGTTIDFDMYWDKAKGVICEINMSFSMAILGYSASQTMTMKLNETNMWGGGGQGLIPGLPDYIFYIIIAVVVTAIIVAAGLAMRRRKAPASAIPPSGQAERSIAPPKEQE